MDTFCTVLLTAGAIYALIIIGVVKWYPEEEDEDMGQI